MAVFDIFKMIIEQLIPKEYVFYVGGTLLFIFVVGPILNLDDKRESHNSKS